MCHRRVLKNIKNGFFRFLKSFLSQSNENGWRNLVPNGCPLTGLGVRTLKIEEPAPTLERGRKESGVFHQKVRLTSKVRTAELRANLISSSLNLSIIFNSENQKNQLIIGNKQRKKYSEDNFNVQSITKLV